MDSAVGLPLDTFTTSLARQDDGWIARHAGGHQRAVARPPRRFDLSTTRAIYQPSLATIATPSKANERRSPLAGAMAMRRTRSVGRELPDSREIWLGVETRTAVQVEPVSTGICGETRHSRSNPREGETGNLAIENRENWLANKQFYIAAGAR
jgi:hypothetical protein